MKNGNLHKKLTTLELSSNKLSGMSISARRIILKKLRFEIVENQKKLADAISSDTGKPVFEALNQEVTAALGMIRFFERKVPHWLKPRKFRYWNPGFWAKHNSVVYEPLGIIAVIGPANYPFSLIVMQAAFAFMCGNSVAIKPSEKCPRTSELIAELFNAVDPEGRYFSVLNGGPQIGEDLISSEKVKKVIFTGSYKTGRRISELAGKYFKSVILELGGSGGAIVCADANLKLAAKGIVWSSHYSNANSCIGTRRVFVEASIADKFWEFLQNEIQVLKSGDAADSNTDINSSLKIILSNAGKSDDFNSDSAQIMFEKFESENKAVDLLNNSEFGLSASVWSKNTRRAKHIARQLDVGMVWINDVSAGAPGFPWGGTKHSGWGRMFSPEAVYALTNAKVISAERRRISTPKFWWFPYTQSKYNLVLFINKTVFGKFTLHNFGRIFISTLNLAKKK